jgi:hypothetical protein
MQFRPIGIESPVEELVPEGADVGEQTGFANASACRGGVWFWRDDCHDAALPFSRATSFAASAFFRRHRQFWRDLLKEGFNYHDQRRMVSNR